MPAMKYYTVTEEHEIKVMATSPFEAAAIAHAKFRGIEHKLIMGRPLSEINVRDIVAREDY